MENLLNKDWWMSALARAIRTFCQTLISRVTVGQAFGEVDWINVISVCGVAFLVSIAMSVIAGVPEAEPSLDVSGIDYLDKDNNEEE